MKRLFLSVLTIVAITTSSVFGAIDSHDIGQLMDRDRLAVEFLNIGALFGTEQARFAVSLNSDTPRVITFGGENELEGNDFALNGSVYAGGGYKTPAFGIWLGYEYGYNADPDLGIDNNTEQPIADGSAWNYHIPHLQFTAMDGNFRLNVPFTIGLGTTKDGNELSGGTETEGVVAFSTEIQARYYTQMDYFTAIRFYVYYGQFDYSQAENATTKAYENTSSVGFQGRFYFDIPTDGPVALSPILKVGYQTSLGDGINDDPSNFLMGQSSSPHAHSVGASAYRQGRSTKIQTGDVNQEFFTTAALALSAANDIVSVYVEPFVGITSVFAYDSPDNESNLAIGNYMELYVYPVANLEIYLELDTGYVVDGFFSLAGSSGFKWYF